MHERLHVCHPGSSVHPGENIPAAGSFFQRDFFAADDLQKTLDQKRIRQSVHHDYAIYYAVSHGAAASVTGFDTASSGAVLLYPICETRQRGNGKSGSSGVLYASFDLVDAGISSVCLGFCNRGGRVFICEKNKSKTQTGSLRYFTCVSRAFFRFGDL